MPTGTTTNPVDGAMNVPTRTEDIATAAVTATVVTVTFSQPVGPTTRLTLKKTATGTAVATDVPGTASIINEGYEVTFTPTASDLDANTQFTATVATQGSELFSWNFTTNSVPLLRRAPVNLRSAGSFAILTQTGITDVYKSAVIGDVGTSPITGAAMLLSCDEVSGNIYTVDAAGPPPCALTDATKLTIAIGDMGTAYDDAAGRKFPDYTEVGDGEIGGKTLAPGLYKWGTGVLISSDVYLSGGPTDVWIFQIAGTVTQASGVKVILRDDALARNVFWQAAGAVSIGTTAVFEGVMLAKTMVAVKTGATVNGRLLAQTAVTLQMNQVTAP